MRRHPQAAREIGPSETNRQAGRRYRRHSLTERLEGAFVSGASSSQGGPAAPSQVRTYLAKLPAGLRTQVLNLRDAIRLAVPQAVESFGYGMPAFALDRKNFVWSGAWKNHISFYPISEATRRALAHEVAGYETSGKGTIRFRSDQDVPTSLVPGSSGRASPSCGKKP